MPCADLKATAIKALTQCVAIKQRLAKSYLVLWGLFIGLVPTTGWGSCGDLITHALAASDD